RVVVAARVRAGAGGAPARVSRFGASAPGSASGSGRSVAVALRVGVTGIAAATAGAAVAWAGARIVHHRPAALISTIAAAAAQIGRARARRSACARGTGSSLGPNAEAPGSP